MTATTQEDKMTDTITTRYCLRGATALVAHNGDEWTWSGFMPGQDDEDDGGRSPRKADCQRDARRWLRGTLTDENRSTR